MTSHGSTADVRQRRAPARARSLRAARSDTSARGARLRARPPARSPTKSIACWRHRRRGRPVRKRECAHERREEALLRLPVLAAAAMAVPTAAATGRDPGPGRAPAGSPPNGSRCGRCRVRCRCRDQPPCCRRDRKPWPPRALTLMHREFGNRPRRWLAALGFGQLGANQRPMRRPEVIGRAAVSSVRRLSSVVVAR